MKAIIIAAGMGTRLLHLTKDMPKCKVEVKGKAIIEHALEAFKDVGITDITIIKGFLGEQIRYYGTKSYYNTDYAHNNILASLFYAEPELNDEILIIYSDIIFEKAILQKAIQAKGEICIVVDEDWEKNYVGRTLHPFDQAEKVYFSDNRIRRIGKHLTVNESNGEFIGMLKLSKKGCEILKETYKDVLEKCEGKPFQHSKVLQKAYLTDMFQELIDRNYDLNPILIRGGWREIDTIEDLKRAGGQITLGKITPEKRLTSLKNILSEKKFVRAIEAHNGISAIVANNAIITEQKKTFDALWISSLTESAAKGQPDIEIMGLDSRLQTINQVLEVTNMPLIVDADTGGDPNAFEFFVRKAEGLGVSAVIIEDKVYPKRNSLDGESKQKLEDPTEFAQKIRRAKHALLTNDFMIIARIESFIAGAGLDDALRRAEEYLEAGADGIMIHSNSKYPDEVISFASHYKELTERIGISKPLVCVPTTYNAITESELQEAGFSLVIHANHLIRSAVKAMQEVCTSILIHGRSLEAIPLCSSVNEIFDLVGFSDIKTKENYYRRYADGRKGSKLSSQTGPNS